jgi:hypothetical protein
VGIWNETPDDTAWIKLLRRTLDRNGLKAVKIVGADEVHAWTIVERMKADPELAAAIEVVAVHYPKYASTAAAKACGESLWSAEDCYGSKAGWAGAEVVAMLCNRNYIQGKMTKTIILWWDTSEGKAISDATVDHKDSILRLTAPRFVRDAACRVEPAN